MIPITRAALPDDLSARLATLTSELAAVPVEERTKAARTLWEKSGTRTRGLPAAEKHPPADGPGT